jgi:long-chain-fatty-acid--CoA ligase ACSBG
LFGKACIAVGASPRKSVNIIGFNSPQWGIAFKGAICANYISAGVYTTNAPDACLYVAEHSEADVIVLENKAQLKKYESVKDKLGFVKAFVLMEEQPPTGVDARYFYWDDFLELGRTKVSDEHLLEQRSHCRPNQVCNLVYTSGTTGMPKGVMLTHDNMTYYMQTALKDALVDYMEYPE